MGSDHLFIRYHIYYDSGSPLALPISLYIATVQAHTPLSAVPGHTGRGSKTGIAYTRVWSKVYQEGHIQCELLDR